MSESCESCRFVSVARAPYTPPPWAATDKEPQTVVATVHCRRYPPRINRSAGTTLESSTFPVTQLDAWCGEYQRPGSLPLRP